MEDLFLLSTIIVRDSNLELGVSHGVEMSKMRNI